MRGLVRTPAAGALGALGLAVIAVLLLRGQLLLADAALRAGVLLAAVVVVERVVLPVARLLVGGPQQEREQPEAGPSRAP